MGSEVVVSFERDGADTTLHLTGGETIRMDSFMNSRDGVDSNSVSTADDGALWLADFAAVPENFALSEILFVDQLVCGVVTVFPLLKGLGLLTGGGPVIAPKRKDTSHAGLDEDQ